MEHLDSHAVVAAQVSLDRSAHRAQPHVGSIQQGERGAIGGNVNQRTSVQIRVERHAGVSEDKLGQLRDVRHEGGVCRIAVVNGRSQSPRLHGCPFGLHYLPTVGRAQAGADLGVHRVHQGNLFVDLFLLRDDVVLARCVAAEEGECARVVRNHFGGEVTEGVEVAGALELQASLIDLLRGFGQIEHSDESRRNDHRDHQDREFLPQSQST